MTPLTRSRADARARATPPRAARARFVSPRAPRGKLSRSTRSRAPRRAARVDRGVDRGASANASASASIVGRLGGARRARARWGPLVRRARRRRPERTRDGGARSSPARDGRHGEPKRAEFGGCGHGGEVGHRERRGGGAGEHDEFSVPSGACRAWRAASRRWRRDEWVRGDTTKSRDR